MGYIPWIIFGGIIAFGLLICGLVFTINQLKGGMLDHSNVHADVNTLKGKKFENLKTYSISVARNPTAAFINN